MAWTLRLRDWRCEAEAGGESPGPVCESGTAAAASHQEDARQRQGGRGLGKKNPVLSQVKINFDDSNPWNEEFDAPT